MALPIANVAKYELTLPSQQKVIHYRPFLVKEEKILLMAMESGESKEMITAIKEIVKSCTFNEMNAEDHPMFDIEYVFLQIRAKSVGEVAKLKVLCPDDGKTYADVEVDLSQIEVFVDDFNSGINIDQFTDSIQYKDITLYSKGKLKYRPQAITSGIAIKNDQPYSDLDRTLTYRYFTNLKNFKYPSINYSLIPEEENALRASINLSPKERFSLGFDLDLSHSNIHDFGIGLGGGLGIRNVFRGAELLELNIKNTLGASRDIAQKGDQFFNLFELGADLKLSVPRLLIPWVKKDLVELFMIPKTEIILGTSFQENIGLDKQFFKGVYQFDIRPDSKKRIQFKLIDLEFVNNRNLSNYFNV